MKCYLCFIYTGCSLHKDLAVIFLTSANFCLFKHSAYTLLPLVGSTADFRNISMLVDVTLGD